MGIFTRKRWQSALFAAVFAMASITGVLANNAFAVAGDIQPWQTATNTPPVGQLLPGYVELNGYMYIIGGTANANSVAATVYYSHLNSSGQPGEWSSTTSLPTALQYMTGFAKNGYVYAFGEGDVEGVSQASDGLYYAHQNADGTLGAWTAVSMPDNRGFASAVIANDYVYIMGGSIIDSNSYNPTPSVYYAHLNSDGSVSAWTPTTVSFPNVIALPNLVTNNSYIYAIGGGKDGYDGTPAYTSVYYTQVHSDGSIDPWTSTKNLPVPTAFSASVVLDGYIYTIGGSPDVSGSVATTSVILSHINNDGSLGDWQTSEHPLPIPLTGAAALEIAGTIYMTGGMGSDYNVASLTDIYFTSVGPTSIAVPTGLTGSTPTNQKPALSWNSVSDATSYTIYRNEAAVGTSTTNSFTDSALTVDGNYTYTVTASNGSLTSPQSAPFTVQYDTTKPTATNGTISGWLVINWGNPTISADVSDNLSGVTSGEYYIDTDPGQGNGQPMTYSNGKISANVIIDSGTIGRHTIYMRSKDAAGNWSTTTSVQYLYVGRGSH